MAHWLIMHAAAEENSAKGNLSRATGFYACARPPIGGGDSLRPHGIKQCVIIPFQIQSIVGRKPMAKSSRANASWKRPGSPIGKKGPRKANPKYKRNMREPWSADDVRM